MENVVYDEKMSNEFFSQDCIHGKVIANMEELENKVHILVSSLGPEAIASRWLSYLQSSIHSREEAFVFATWLYIYDFGKFKLANPYPFLAVLYKKLELDENVDDELESRMDTPYDRFFDLYVELLISSGIIGDDDVDFANPDKDQKLLQELQSV